MKNLLAFSFIFLTTFNFAQNEHDCTPFQKGYFEYIGKHENTIIYRDLEYQIEYNIQNDEWVFIKMNWVVDCSYQFTYISTNDEDLKPWIGELATVVVEQIYSPNSYSYFTLFRKDLSRSEGVISSVEKISKKLQRKVQKKFNEQKAIHLE